MPVYDEEDNLEPLMEELETVLKKTGRNFEVLCVNDCSTDNSPQVIQRLQKTRPFLRVVHHRVNSGESAAEATGFEHALGDVVITIDADQQNDPADIPALLDALKDNVHAVCGIRRKREDDWIRRLSSKSRTVSATG